MSSAIMNPKMSAMDSSMIAVNRSKLMKLAEGIKTKKKPNHKKALNFKKDPGYTNIEHLVFGTYRPRNSPSSLPTSPATNGSSSPPPPPPNSTGHEAVKQHPQSPGPKVGSSDDAVEVATPKSNGSTALAKNGLKSPKLSWRSVFPASVLPASSPCHPPSAGPNVTDSQSPTAGLSDPMDLDDGAPLPYSCRLRSPESCVTQPFPEMDGCYVVPELPPSPGLRVTVAKSGTAPNGFLQTSVHSPPVHALTLGKYLTREFSADFESPEAAVCNGKPPKSPRSDSSKTATVAGARTGGKQHVTSIYQTSCCLSSGSVNEAPSRSATASPRGMPRSATVAPPPPPPPGRPPLVAGRASMRIPAKDPAPKDRNPANGWSFRAASAKGKTGGAKAGAPVRSVSLCVATNKMVKSDDDDHRKGSPHPVASPIDADVTGFAFSNDDLPTAAANPLPSSPGAASRQLSRPTASEDFPRCPTGSVEVPPPSRKVSGKGTSEIPIATRANNPKKLTTRNANPSSSALAAAAVPHRNSFASASASFRGRPTSAIPSGSQRQHLSRKGVGGEATATAVPLATTVQAMRKVSVSATNPARPTVSTKVKIVVTANGEVDSTCNSDRTEVDVDDSPHRHHHRGGPLKTMRCDSRSSLAGSRSSLADTKSRSSSRGSLTGVRMGSAAASSQAVALARKERTRTASAPAVATTANLTARGRSSSATSLSGSQRRLSSASSLGGSQSSLSSVTMRKSSAPARIPPDPCMRHSFHASGCQRSTASRTVKNTAVRTSAPNAVSTIRQSLRLPPSRVAGKPPVYPPKGIQSPRSPPIQTFAPKIPAEDGPPCAAVETGGSTPASETAAPIPECREKPDLTNGDAERTSPVIDRHSPVVPAEVPLPLVEVDVLPDDEEVRESGVEPTVASIESGLDCIAAAINELRLLEAVLNNESAEPVSTSRGSEGDLPETVAVAAVPSPAPSTPDLQSNPQPPVRPAIRRATSLPKSSFLLAPPSPWDHATTLAAGNRRSLPARSLSLTARNGSTPEISVDLGAPDAAVRRKEFSLSCASKDGPASPGTDVLSRSSSNGDADEVDRAGLVSSGSVEVEKVPLSVVDLVEGTDVDDVDHAAVVAGDDDETAERSVSAANDDGHVKAPPPPPLACEDGCRPAITVTAVSEAVKSNCERSVPKCVRRIKAASSPVFVENRVDSWVSESNLHRPWSQICSDRDVERLVQAKSCGLGSAGSIATSVETIVQIHPSTAGAAAASSSSSEASPAAGSLPGPSTSPTSSQSNLFARFSSMRTPGARPPGSPVEGVLQKFRKSFSARFYKKVKGESPPSPHSSSASKVNARHASFSSYLDDGVEADPVPNGGGSLATSSFSDISADGPEGETIFRLGPIVWRSSKEKKENGKKMRKDGRANDSSPPSSSVDKPEASEPFGGADAADRVSADQNPLEVSDRKSVIPSHPRPNAYHNCVAISPHLLRRRSQSTTLHPERLKRPLSDQSGALHGSIILSDSLQISRVVMDGGDISTPNSIRHPRPVRNGSLGPYLRSSSTETSPFPSVPVIRRDKRTPGLRWSRGKSNLRRSVSQPLEMEKLDGQGRASHSPGGLSDHEDLGHDLSTASSEEEIHCDVENGTISGSLALQGNRHYVEYIEPVLYAEALWDHVTMDPEELAFKVGELVEVLDIADNEWWWGVIGSRVGWFPASFVRPRVNQEGTVEDCVTKLSDGTMCLQNSRTMSISLLSNDEIRTNVIKEIISTERDFVRHLKDVCEGYLKQMRKRLDMFPEERINVIFGNIEQLYAFQSEFVSKLEQCINWEHPHLSQIGSCFTEHREGFEIYSEYCNNHPQAVSELQQLYTMPKYAHFFEACRLLQDMIDISLDGFLLTPVQKICKYPLQLAELLKYTKPNHPDYQYVSEALDTMRNVAHYINERKRRMECLEKLAAWQMTVEYWEGADLLDDSSELIYSADVSKVTASWSRDFTLFLFDHQLIICKKDLLKRNSYSYKGRINIDTCELKDIPDGKDTQYGLNLKNAWKLYCLERGKWIVFATRTTEEKQKWMKAFEDERRRVDDDKKAGFVVSDKAKKTAIMVVVQNRKKPKRPKDKENKNLNRRLTRPDVYIVSSKSSSLPSNVLLSTNKKKTTSGWFHFGSNKKTKR